VSRFIKALRGRIAVQSCLRQASQREQEADRGDWTNPFSFTAFGDVAGDPKTSLLAVTLAPGESLGEDYKFNDGGKQPLMGGMTIIGGKLNEWPSVYEVRCEATRVRYQDGTVWKLF
jgi:hypothetical protein